MTTTGSGWARGGQVLVSLLMSSTAMLSVGCGSSEQHASPGANSAPTTSPGPTNAGSAGTPANTAHPTNTSGTSTSEPQPTGAPDHKVAPGSYGSPGDTNDPAAMQAAQGVLDAIRAKAGDSSLTISRVLSVQTQVVAGKNYKMDLEVNTSSGAKKIRVVVFRDLQQKYSLTEYQAL